MDFTVSVGETILSYLSDADGGLDFVDHVPGFPAMDLLVDDERIGEPRCKGCQGFRDMNNDGIMEYYRIIPGELANESNGRIRQDDAAIYDPESLYLEIFHSDYQPIAELPRVTQEQMHTQLRWCASRNHPDAQCYSTF